MIWHIARREWLEQSRQPMMLLTVGSLYLLISALSLTALGLLQVCSDNPATIAQLGQLAATIGLSPDHALETLSVTTLRTFGFLMHTQYLGFVAVICGHSVLHDRQIQTLPFLLLAPINRTHLLLGKLLGAIGPITLMWYGVIAVTAGLMTQLEVSQYGLQYLPLNPAWWLSYGIGGPLWGMFIGSLCVIVSTFSRDVRTAQQGVWFIVFFAALSAGWMLSGRLSDSISPQVEAIVVALAGLVLTVGFGLILLSRDLQR